MVHTTAVSTMSSTSRLAPHASTLFQNGGRDVSR